MNSLGSLNCCTPGIASRNGVFLSSNLPPSQATGGNSFGYSDMHDHENCAITQLEKLRQNGTVAEYKAAHDVLAAKAAVPMEMRII